jgi:predicted MFS family arabinose efflux permease
MLTSLIWLALGAFAIGTEGYVIAGVLPAVAGDLGVSIPVAGQLVTAFALTYALGAPLISVAAGALDRRRLLLGSLAVFAAGNLAAMLAHGYAGLLAARLVMALAAATFMPAASAYAAELAPPARRGWALSIIYSGLTLALGIGTPLGVVIGHRWGWRLTFAGVAGFSLIAIVGLRLVLRSGATPIHTSLAERLAVARRPDVLIVLASTVLMMAGVFSVYTYLAPFLRKAGGIDGQALALVLFFFGLGGAAGNLLGGRASDRWNPRRVVGGVLVALMLLFPLLSLAAQLLPVAVAAPVLVALIALWGLVGYAFPSSQQSRLVRLDPRLAPITLSLNGSAVYAGISLGALLGSIVVGRGHLTALGWAAAACEALAFAVLQLAPGERRAPALAASAVGAR